MLLQRYHIHLANQRHKGRSQGETQSFLGSSIQRSAIAVNQAVNIDVGAQSSTL